MTYENKLEVKNMQTWQKAALVVSGLKEDDKLRRRTFNNVKKDADPDNLAAFGALIGQLTAEATQTIQLTEVSEVTGIQINLD